MELAQITTRTILIGTSNGTVTRGTVTSQHPCGDAYLSIGLTADAWRPGFIDQASDAEWIPLISSKTFVLLSSDTLVAEDGTVHFAPTPQGTKALLSAVA